MLHKNVTSKQKDKNDNQTISNGKGQRKKKISSDELKSRFKSGNMPSN